MGKFCDRHGVFVQEGPCLDCEAMAVEADATSGPAAVTMKWDNGHEVRAGHVRPCGYVERVAFVDRVTGEPVSDERARDAYDRIVESCGAGALGPGTLVMLGDAEPDTDPRAYERTLPVDLSCHCALPRPGERCCLRCGGTISEDALEHWAEMAAAKP